MFEKHLWKSDILSKDADHRPAVKTNYLVSTQVEHWSKIGEQPKAEMKI